jgi:hypothetical protein
MPGGSKWKPFFYFYFLYRGDRRRLLTVESEVAENGVRKTTTAEQDALSASLRETPFVFVVIPGWE